MNSMGRVATITATIAIAGSTLAAGIASAAGGDPDAGAFATTGFNSVGFSGNAPASDVGLQGGKVITAGVSGTVGNERATLVRFNSNGLIDSTYNGGGSFFDEYNFEDARINGMAVQSDGEQVTGGVSGNSLEFGVMARHPAEGGDPPDLIELGSLAGATTNEINDVAIASGGKIVGVGSATFPSGQDFYLMGLTASFGRDAGFGPVAAPDGDVVTNVSSVLLNASGADSAETVAVDPADGDIIVAGSVDPDPAAGGDTSNVAVLRYTSAGNLDTGSGFGGGTGVANIDIGSGGSDVAADVAVQPDGKILVTGNRFAGAASNHFVMRLNANGTPDTSFGDGADGIFVQTAVSASNTGTGLALTPEGKVYVGGTAFLIGSNDWVLARYTAAGLPDTAFSGDGSRTYPFNPDSGELNQIVLQPDGKVVGAGVIDGQVAVGRFKADDPPVVNPPVNPPVVNPPVLTPAPTAKKCKKGQKLKKGKCVKKKRKKK